jgi:UDP-glucuronate decarboxylase
LSDLLLPDHLAEALRASDLRIVVTGAGGWIGGATLEMLAAALGPERLRRRVAAFASRDRLMRLRTGVEVPLASLDRLAELSPAPSILLHYAFLTRDKVMSMPPGQYESANAEITANLRRAIERLRPSAMFLASSGAVYGPGRTIESDMSRNPYGVLKHRDEQAFAAICRRCGAKFVVARVFNLSGEYINKLSSYALASFIVDALAGRPIEIRASRLVERSYIHVGDIVSLALSSLLAVEEAPDPFDTAGERIVEIGELARLARECCGRGELEIRRPGLDAGQPADRYVGDPTTMRKIAARNGLVFEDLRRQVFRTVEYLRQMGPPASTAPASSR